VELPLIHIPSLGVVLVPNSMLDTCLPLALILITISTDMQAIAVRFRGFPSALVVLSICPCPDPVTEFHTMAPLPIIVFAVVPEVESVAVSHAVLELAAVFVSILIYFNSLSMSQVISPLSKIDSPIMITHIPKTNSLLLSNLTFILRVAEILRYKICFGCFCALDEFLFQFIERWELKILFVHKFVIIIVVSVLLPLSGSRKVVRSTELPGSRVDIQAYKAVAGTVQR
jgi:hypothetical protein